MISWQRLNKQLVVKALCVTLFAWLLSFIFTAPFSASVSGIFASPEKNDFEMADLFAQVAEGRPVRALQDKIAIVDIAQANRNDIAEILEILALCGPRRVGLDVNFAVPHEDDSRLLTAIASMPDIVLPVGLNEDGTGIESVPFFYNPGQEGITYAASNLPGKYAKSTIRKMRRKFTLADGSSVPGFAAAMAGGESRVDGTDDAVIDYTSKEFRIYDWHEIAEHPEEFADKYVLVGGMSDADDMHATPINSYMSGMMIHAYALSTLLNGENFRRAPASIEYALSMLACFVLVFLTIYMTSKVKGLVLRVIQVVMVYVIVRVGYSLYVDHRIISDLSYMVLMTAFGIFALDVWNGLEYLVEKIRKLITTMNNKRLKKLRNTITLLAIAIGICNASAQHYTVHSTTQGVTVESSGKTQPAVKGLGLKATDCLVIPNGGEVQILNGLDKRIYKSMRPGKISVTKLMIEAREVAADNAKNVSARLNFGKSGKSTGKNVYVERGMVTRSLASYDPAAGNREISSESLATAVAASINGSLQPTDSVPLIFTHQNIGSDGLKFDLHNTLDFPVYFNILRVAQADGQNTVEISPLGQPDGTYVLLPRQTISRAQLSGLAPDEQHFIVITACNFDINKLLDATETALKEEQSADNSLPFFIKKL